MTSFEQKQAVQSAFLDTVRDLIRGGSWAPEVAEHADRIFREVEAQLVELVFIPEDKQLRVHESLKAQLVGLIELARLEALMARRELILQGIYSALSVARRVLLKL